MELLNHSDAGSLDVESWVYRYDIISALNFRA